MVHVADLNSRCQSLFSSLLAKSVCWFAAVFSRHDDFNGAEIDSNSTSGFSCTEPTGLCFGKTGLQALQSTIDIGFFPERSAVDQSGRDIGILLATICFLKVVEIIFWVRVSNLTKHEPAHFKHADLDLTCQPRFNLALFRPRCMLTAHCNPTSPPRRAEEEQDLGERDGAAHEGTQAQPGRR